MVASHPEQIKPRRHWWVGLPFLALVILGAFFVFPRATLTQSATALARLQTTSFFSHLENAQLLAGHQEVPITVKNDRLWPQQPLPAGESGTIRLVLDGPLGIKNLIEVPWKTPANPALSTSAVSTSVGRPTSLTFRGPVQLLTIVGKSGHVVHLRLPRPQSSVVWDKASKRPGQTAIFHITVQARAWELPSNPTLVHWTTTPWLTLHSTRPQNTPLASPTDPVEVHFSQPLWHPSLSRWHWASNVTGQWTEVNSSTFRFSPQGLGFGPGALPALTIPGGTTGPRAQSGSYLAQSVTLRWTVTPGSILRIQQILAQLDYLPLSWHPSTALSASTSSAAGFIQMAYQPPPGTFQWRYPNIPPSLQTLWSPGTMNTITMGALMTFQRVSGLTPNGVLSSSVWRALYTALKKHATNPYGYSYAYVSETLPETIQVWKNGQVVLSSLANTGIPQSPTYIGTSPIYVRYRSQTMQGVTPWGTHYFDQGIPWVNYFKGGDAVHGFLRAHYGYPQSLGCVELPFSSAAKAWTFLHYGTLVTVAPPGSPRLP